VEQKEEDAGGLPAVASGFRETKESLEVWASLEFTNNCSEGFNCKV